MGEPQKIFDTLIRISQDASALVLKRPGLRESIVIVHKAIPVITSWIVFSSLIVGGVGFLILEVFRALGSSMGYTWARMLTGGLCMLLGSTGLRLMKNKKIKSPAEK